MVRVKAVGESGDRILPQFIATIIWQLYQEKRAGFALNCKMLTHAANVRELL